jgi:hypothetical protein
MDPKPGQNIKVFFRNGNMIEGQVVSWTDQKSVIASITKHSYTVINKTAEDVLMYRISENVENLIQKINQIKETPKKTQQDIQSMVSLKKELSQIEAEEIREKLNSHQLSEVKQTNYGIPTNIKIGSTPEYPAEKATGANTKLNTSLRNLFKKD